MIALLLSSLIICSCGESKKQVEFVLLNCNGEGLRSLSVTCTQICPYCKSAVAFQSTVCVTCKKEFVWPEKIDKDYVVKEIENYRSCGMNIANLNTALLMYSSDNLGAYPDSLYKLTPSYLKKLSTCPNSQMDYGYSANNVPNMFNKGFSNNSEYTIYCKGTNHKFFYEIEDSPKYNSKKESFVD
jgi:hypothetical protein